MRVAEGMKKDVERFRVDLGRLTTTCNACHVHVMEELPFFEAHVPQKKDTMVWLGKD